MFFRLKKSGDRGYVQIVENKREGAAVRQRVIANLGRADELAASGALASLIASGAKLTDQVLLISALDHDAEGALSALAKRIGGPLLFGRIWERLGVADVLGDLLKERAFGFAVERAVFVAALHRLFVSGSDRDCASWIEDYDIPGAEGLELHHFYRAMAWLGEELEEKPGGAIAPRCIKDLIEEKLFDRRRDLSPPTQRSRRCRRSCAIAICSRSRTCSAGPRRSCARGRSFTPPTPPSAGMSFVPSWRLRCRSICTTSCAKPALFQNGRTSCATSTVSQKYASAIAAPIGWCALTPRPRSRPSSAPLTSPCRRAPVTPVRRPPNPSPPENAAAAQGVVPRRLEFRRNASTINYLQNSGVQVGPQRHRCRSRADP